MDLPLTDETKKAILATAETDETFKSIAGRLSVHISDVCEVLNPEDRYKKLILLKDGTVRKCKRLVLFGAPVGTPADMWSLACLIAQLLTGNSLLNDDTTDGEITVGRVTDEEVSDEKKRDEEKVREVICNITDIIGQPTILEMASIEPNREKRISNINTHFNGRLVASLPTNSIHGVIASVFDQSSEADHYRTTGFLKRCLVWSPENRLTPSKATKDTWIRNYHIPSVNDPTRKLLDKLVPPVSD